MCVKKQINTGCTTTPLLENILQMLVPRVRIELGKKRFKYAAPIPGIIEELWSILKDCDNSIHGQCVCS